MHLHALAEIRLPQNHTPEQQLTVLWKHEAWLKNIPEQMTQSRDIMMMR